VKIIPTAEGRLGAANGFLNMMKSTGAVVAGKGSMWGSYPAEES
jgi:hypothetical protein